MPVVCDISQGNLLNQAAQNGLQTLWLGPREGEATQFSELSQIDRHTIHNGGWQPLNICHQ